MEQQPLHQPVEDMGGDSSKSVSDHPCPEFCKKLRRLLPVTLPPVTLLLLILLIVGCVFLGAASGSNSVSFTGGTEQWQWTCNTSDAEVIQHAWLRKQQIASGLLDADAEHMQVLLQTTKSKVFLTDLRHLGTGAGVIACSQQQNPPAVDGWLNFWKDAEWVVDIGAPNRTVTMGDAKTEAKKYLDKHMEDRVPGENQNYVAALLNFLGQSAGELQKKGNVTRLLMISVYWISAGLQMVFWIIGTGSRICSRQGSPHRADWKLKCCQDLSAVTIKSAMLMSVSHVSDVELLCWTAGGLFALPLTFVVFTAKPDFFRGLFLIIAFELSVLEYLLVFHAVTWMPWLPSWLHMPGVALVGAVLEGYVQAISSEALFVKYVD